MNSPNIDPPLEVRILITNTPSYQTNIDKIHEHNKEKVFTCHEPQLIILNHHKVIVHSGSYFLVASKYWLCTNISSFLSCTTRIFCCLLCMHRINSTFSLFSLFYVNYPFYEICFFSKQGYTWFLCYHCYAIIDLTLYNTMFEYRDSICVCLSKERNQHRSCFQILNYRLSATLVFPCKNLA